MNGSARHIRPWALGLLLGALPLGAQSLHWANGDSLPGAPVELKDGALTWKCPLFSENLVIDSRALSRIQFGKPPPPPKADGTLLLVETRHGDLLHGTLTAMDPETLTLASPRFGTLQLQRSELLSLQPLASSRSYTLRGTRGWTTLNKQTKTHRWRPTARLGLATHMENSHLFHTLQGIGPKLYEITLSWKHAPGFVFGVQAREGAAFCFKLETWDGTLVLLNGKQFKPVLELNKDPAQLALRIFHKPGDGQVAVCDSKGKLLAQLRSPEPHPAKDIGLYIKNKGQHLALESLHDLKWSGSRPDPIASADKTRILLRDGTARQGKATTYDPEAKALLLDGTDPEGAQPMIRLADLARIQFDTTPATRPAVTGRLAYADGMFLCGQLLAIRNNQLTLRIQAASQPFEIALTGCTNLHFPTPPTDKPKAGRRLVWDKGHSHGTLAPSPGREFPLAWTPAGSSKPASLRKDAKLQIHRMATAPAPKATDILNLTDRSAHPVNIQRITRDKVHFTAAYLPAPTTLPTSRLKAVQFNNGTLGINFADKQWKLIRRNANPKGEPLKMQQDRVVLQRSMGISHPTALSSGNAELSLDWSGASYFSIRMDLFVEDLNASNSTRHQFRLHKSGNRLYWLDAQRRSNNSVSLNADLSKVTIRIESSDETIQAFADKQKLYEGNLPNGRPGGGFALHLESISSRNDLGVSSFKSGNSTLHLTRETRQQLLNLPRLLQDKPPPHILAAPNGDLLRGELHAFTLDTATFRSRVREIQVPRERLAGLVWLEHLENQPAQGATARLSLTQGHAIFLEPTALQDGRLQGRSPTFGECSIALDQVQLIELGSPAPEKRLPSYSDWKLTQARPPAEALKGEGPYHVEFYPVSRPVLNKMLQGKVPPDHRDPFDDPAARPNGQAHREAILAYLKNAGIPMDDPDCGFVFDGRQMVITHADNIHQAIRKLLDELE